MLYNLGVCISMVFNGQGVRQDYNVAKEYFGKACDLGLQHGCDDYTRLSKQGR